MLPILQYTILYEKAKLGTIDHPVLPQSPQSHDFDVSCRLLLLELTLKKQLVFHSMNPFSITG